MPDRLSHGPDEPTLQSGARDPAPDDSTIGLGASGTGATASMLQERLGPYRVVRELGRGGMGVVLLAHDARLERDIAIKLLPADAGAADAVRERLLSEARTLAAMNHPNIATIHTLEEDAGRQFITMELVEGRSLHNRVTAGSLPLEETLSVVRQVVRGLEAAHAKGVIHRDLKPANVMLRPDGTAKRRLIDAVATQLIAKLARALIAGRPATESRCRSTTRSRGPNECSAPQAERSQLRAGSGVFPHDGGRISRVVLSRTLAGPRKPFRAVAAGATITRSFFPVHGASRYSATKPGAVMRSPLGNLVASAPASRSRRATYQLSVALVAALTLPAAALASNFYYVGPSGGSWSSAANWSATSGGVGGAGVPGVGDRAILNPSTTKSVLFDADYAVPGLLQLYLDGQGGATVTLDQGAHAMVGTVESVGIQGNGVYHQTGGSNATTGDFHVGQAGGGTGTYLLDNGSLDVGASEYVGESSVQGSSTGNFTQSGGTHHVGDALKIAFDPGSTGHFTLHSGPVTVGGSGYLTIGYRGTATFAQDGGSVDALHMNLAEGLNSSASYTLDSGTLTVSGSEDIGTGGVGMFTQNGGTHTMTGNLYLTLGAGGPNAGSSGTYNLNGGTLNVSGNIMNNGTMTQSAAANLNLGGTVIGNGIIHTNGPLSIANQSNINTGTFQIEGGTATGQTLIVGKDATNPDIPSNTIPGNGTLNIQGGTTTVSGTLGAGNDGTLTAGAGNGHIDVSGGTLNAATVILGSTTGGSADLRVSGAGQVVVGGGLSGNDVTMDGGSLQVLDQAPPPGEDPMLNRSMVGGYLRDGAMHVHAGVVRAPKLKLGVTSGKVGSMDMDGGTMTVGILGAGNDATLTGGTGTGHVTISGGTLNASTIMLGSPAGGSGDLRVSGAGQVVVGGGLTMNDLIMDGGSLQVLNLNPPAGEDPVLDRSLVGGYLHDGAMIMNAGTVTTPNLKIGVTAGKVGALTMNGGTLTTTNLLASNGAGSVIVFNGGTLVTAHSEVDGGVTLAVGNGTNAAKLVLNLGGHVFARGMSLSPNGQLTGAGSITGSVTNSGTLSPGINVGDAALMTISGSYTQTSGGSLVMDLGSGAAGTGYDALRVSGGATLAGTLNVRFVGTRLPSVGQQAVLMIAHPITGTFATVMGAGVVVSYTDTSVVATFTGLDVAPGDRSGLALALRPVQPNPFRTSAEIAFELPRAATVSLAIHDASGRLVRALAQGEFEAGRHSVNWDGRSESGARVQPGVYLVRLTAMGKNLSRKLIVQ